MTDLPDHMLKMYSDNYTKVIEADLALADIKRAELSKHNHVIRQIKFVVPTHTGWMMGLIDGGRV